MSELSPTIIFKDESYAIQGAIINYLHATDFKLGMLVNFSAYPKTTVMRILNTDKVHPV